MPCGLAAHGKSLMSFYPRIEEICTRKSLRGTLFEVRRSLRSSLTHILLFFFSATVAGLIIFFFGDIALAETGPLSYFSAKLLAFGPLYHLFELWRRHEDDLYEFELHHLTHKDGRLSLKYSVPIVKYIDIRSISVVQDIFGRIFDYGNVEVATSAQEATEVVIEGVCGPKELARLIDQLRRLSSEVLRREFEAGLETKEDDSGREPRKVVQSRSAAGAAVVRA